MGFSNLNEAQLNNGSFHLSSFQNINQYIHAEEPAIKRIDDSKIKSMIPKIQTSVEDSKVLFCNQLQGFSIVRIVALRRVKRWTKIHYENY